MSDSGRNPLIIPSAPTVAKRGCPACGEADWDAFMSYGVATFTCRKCKNRWQGGIGVVPADPSVPTPPIDPRDLPTVDFVRTRAGGDTPQEIRPKRVDVVPSFRKGAPIPGEDDGI